MILPIISQAKIGDNILNKKNMDNYNKSKKIYTNNFSKIIQMILSISDLIRLFFIKTNNHQRYNEHSVINETIDLNDRF